MAGKTPEKLLRQRYEHRDRHGVLNYLVVHENGDVIYYPEAVMVSAHIRESIARGMRQFYQPPVPLEDFLLLGDRYDFRTSIFLLVEGYRADELVIAFDNGIDIGLLDSLRDVVPSEIL